MSKYYKLLLTILGTTCFLLSILVYFLLGYSVSVLIFWFTSILTFAAFFYSNHSKRLQPIFAKKDILAIAILLLIFIPIYTLKLHNVAFQISADEVTFMRLEKLLANSPGVDIFGLSPHFGFPTLFFWILGKLGMMLGGATLTTMRFLHAVTGIGIALSSYLFFRILGKNKSFSFIGAIFVGANHSLLAISRMALRDNNLPTLLELLCLPLFYLGVKRSNFFYIFLAGLISGIGFYAYFPARLIPLVCLFFLLLVRFVKRGEGVIFNNLKVASVFILGILLTSNLVFIATFKNLDQAMQFPREQLLIYEEGRNLQQKWVGASTIEEGIKTNIKNGLSLFNNKIVDHGWVYYNEGHGFVDPITGILVWLGFMATIWKIKNRRNVSDVLILSSFVLLLLINSFIINKAPDYTRVLILLPFSAYLSVQGLLTILEKSIFSKWRISFFAFIILIILTLNLGIYNDFVKSGKTKGDDIGSTVRYVEGNHRDSGYSYYLVYNSEYPFYDYPGTWYDYFLGKSQTSATIDPNLFEKTELKTPSTLFMSDRFFEKVKSNLESRYTFNIKNMTPDGRLVAIEIR